jgi:hypothetical protein
VLPCHAVRTAALPSLLPLLVLATTGCAFRTPAASLPPVIAGGGPAPARVSVMWVHVASTAGKVDRETDAEVCDRTVQILDDAAKRSATGDGLAEVRVKVVLGPDQRDIPRLKNDGIGLMPLLPVFLSGVIYERQSVSVALSVRREGHTFMGRGEAWKDGSIYASARDRALAVALDRALADAARAGDRD